MFSGSGHRAHGQTGGMGHARQERLNFLRFDRLPAMRLFLLLLTLPLLAACSSVTTRRDPGAKLGQYQRFFVEQRLNDNHATGDLIAAELRARGLQADCGPVTMMPDDTQVLISYDARWTWDFHSYLIDLSMTARHARTEKVIATGNFHHPGLTPKKPEAMIRKILDDFFGN